ncbi:MAG: NRDE family protein [Flavitalea sp.]
MCTVSFIPQGDRIYITSNRDEKSSRKAALVPEFYNMNTGRIAFPKDGHAGGTWIAIHENGNALVFLNGAEKKHEKKQSYRKSRGVILLELIDSEDPITIFRSIDLHNIEPFTAITWSDGQLYQCRWNGVEKEILEKDITTSHIWASSTLYSDEVIGKRRKWFNDFLSDHPEISQQDVLDFHMYTGDGDTHNDLRINRGGVDMTVSVTSLLIENENISMRYIDLLHTTDVNLHSMTAKLDVK